MTKLPRPERGDYDGVYIGAKPWTDLGGMLSIVDEEVRVKAISSNNPRDKWAARHARMGPLGPPV